MAYAKMSTLAIIIVVVMISISIVIIWTLGSHRPSGFGKFEVDNRGVCNTGSNSCTDSGTRLITMTCIPNPSTGKGCLDDEGNQVFGQVITSESCAPTCRRAVWVDHSIGPCVVKGVSATQCVNPDIIGTREVTVECVANDSSGTNMCTSMELAEIIGPTGESSESHQLTVHNIGDQIMVNRSCTDYSNPICGEWELTRPLDRDFSLPVDEEQGESSVQCSFDIQLTAEEICAVTGLPPFDALLEGFIIEPLSCVFETDQGEIATKPDNSDPLLEICERIESPPLCNNDPLDPSQIRDVTLPLDLNPVICPGNSNTSNNSQCIRACRLFPGSTSIGGGEFDAILGTIFFLRVPGYGYIAGAQTPANDGNVIKFRDNHLSPSDPLDDTPLMLIPDSITRPHCTGLDPQSSVEFSTAAAFSLGPRQYVPGQLTVQMSAIIDASYAGWLGLDGNRIIWGQMYNRYSGPGITSIDASSFRIINFSFSPGPPPQGFPDEYIGAATLDLRSSNGSNLAVLDVDDVSHVLDGITALVFRREVELAPRVSRSRGNCNLLHDTNEISLMTPI